MKKVIKVILIFFLTNIFSIYVNAKEVYPLYDTIEKSSILDNISSEYVTSNDGINYKEISSNTNGKGLYKIASTKNEKYPIIFYRGDVTNNNVVFKNYCWQIVRSTETGGLKLIYNGVANDNKCTLYQAGDGIDRSIGTSKFNELRTTGGKNGYMFNDLYTSGSINIKNTSYLYGNDVIYEEGKYKLIDTKTINWTTSEYQNVNDYHYTCLNTTGECENVYYIYYVLETNITKTFYALLENGNTVAKMIEEKKDNNILNKNESIIKQFIENWYEEKLLSSTKFIEDTPYCNDRTVTDAVFTQSGWNKNGGNVNNIYNYRSYIRFEDYTKPSFECSKNDSFSVKETSTTNGKSKYPVGLLTADEANYAGTYFSKNNNNFYLYIGVTTWLMTPHRFYDVVPYNLSLYSTGNISTGPIDRVYAIRPVISLKENTIFIDGNGEASNPYVIGEAYTVNFDIPNNLKNDINLSPKYFEKDSNVLLDYLELNTEINGYKFIGWESSDVKINNSTFIMPEKNVTIK